MIAERMNLLSSFPLEIDVLNEGRRVDRFLSDLAVGFSRSQISDWILSGKFLVNNRRVKPSYRLKCGDTLFLTETLRPEKLDLESTKYKGPQVEILWEDSDLVVVNKPEGLVVHPGSGVPFCETLAGWLHSERSITESVGVNWPQELLDLGRMGIVHRLDKGTSGAIILAKNPRTHERFLNMFQEHQIHRIYWALVQEDLPLRLKKRSSKVDAYLLKGWAGLKRNSKGIWSLATHHGRDPKNPLRYRVEKEGKTAVSHFICRGNRERDSFIELKLATGRTHQIRVQMAFLGAPILGDSLYGAAEDAARIYLHAVHMSFLHPWSGERIAVEAPSRSFETFSKILGYRPQDYRDHSMLLEAQDE